MPRNGSGVMQQVPDTQGVANEVIRSAKYNAVIADLIAEMNSVRPAAYGGTGYATLALALAAAGFGDIADLLYRDVQSQTITGGGAYTALDHGTKSTGTLTIDVSDCGLQKVIDGGAFVLDFDDTKLGWCTLVVTNNGSAGAIDITAFGDNVYGDVHVLTNGEVFAFDIRVIATDWAELTIRQKV